MRAAFGGLGLLMVAGWVGVRAPDTDAAGSATAVPSVIAPIAGPAEASAAQSLEPSTPLTPATALEGLPGAAAALASKDAARALDLLSTLPEPEAGGEEWFIVGALRGRAYILLDRPGDAVKALESRAKHRRVRHHFPRDMLGLELAKARVAWARSGELDTAAADAQRRAAITELGRLKKHEPLRTFAAIRVLQARAMGEVEGTSKSSRLRAAIKAHKALKKVIEDYPNHPEIGSLRLLYAKALERKGKAKDAAKMLRRLSVERTGERDGERAWEELQRIGREQRSVKVRPYSLGETLDRATWARRHRRVAASREILDALIADPKTPTLYRNQAILSRSYTAYKQRDFARCADDLRPVYAKTKNVDIRDSLIRCLERGAMYDEAIAIIMADGGKSKRKNKRAHATWRATNLAFRGGKYDEAKKLLAKYARLSKGHRNPRLWMEAWLAYRTGDDAKAIEAFKVVEKKVRSSARRARYFRGKLQLRSKDANVRAEGETLLRYVATRDKLGYYGLMARQRLLDAKLEPPPMPTLAPMPSEAVPPDRIETQALLTSLADKYGSAWPPLRRAEQAYAAGYLEEARREIRVGSEAFLSAGKKRSSGPRSEAILVGLGWKSTWKYPKVRPTKSGRKSLRDRAAQLEIRQGLHMLARALDEPYHYVKMTQPGTYSFKQRWHPRAYRAAVEREARFRDIDPVHMWSLMYTESRFRRHVVSPVGARGALQIMPWTARQLALRLGELEPGVRFDTDSLFDIDTNAHLAGYYVAELLAKFHGQPAMAYASYNGGPSNVARWLTAKAKGGAPLELDAFIEEIAFTETYRYTKRVLEVSAAYELMYAQKLPRWTNAVDAKVESNIDF